MSKIINDKYFLFVDTKYGKFKVFINDVGAVTQSLIEYGEWAENELRFLHYFIKEGSSVVDVGAYIGTHSIAFAHFVGPKGKVISIEAQQISFNLLNYNILINNIYNIKTRNAIASFEPGMVLIPEIQIENQCSFGSTSLLPLFSSCSEGFKEINSSENQVEVEAITIDNLPLDSCALIKIDAEGMEDLVLCGAKQTIIKHRPVIYAECNSVEAGIKTYKVLMNNGYKILAHVVPAFHPNNFRNSTKNLFNQGCEVAIVGLSNELMAEVDRYKLSAGELLLRIETADDLVLALLNKPQYSMEVLRTGSAARSGGTKCLDTADAIRFEAERLRSRIHEIEHQAEQAESARRDVESELRSIYRSRSWQITLFLRKVTKNLRLP